MDFLHAGLADDLAIWLETHRSLVLLTIGAAAFVEGLVFVGLFTSSLILVGLATTALANGFSLGSILAAAALGAVLGDNASYWVGRLSGERFRDLRDRPRFPARGKRAIERGEKFFERFGTWAVVLGRAVPPVRSVVPFTAGLARMSLQRFVLVDLLTCFVWAVVLGLFVAGIGRLFG